MTDRLVRSCRVTAYRTQAGDPGGFVYQRPEFFEDLPNAVEITDLAIRFEIEKTLASTPNTCTLKIYNCNERERDDLVHRPLYVRIEAGYNGEYRHVFAGDLTRGYSTIKDTDWETTLLLGEGSRVVRYARIGNGNGRSYKRGTPKIVAIRDAALSMGLVLPKELESDPEVQRQFATGESLTGPARDELSRLLATFGYSWSIQNGALVVLRDDQAVDGQAIVVDDDNWLLGTPEWSTPDASGKPPTLKFDTQLYPEIVPGKKVALGSRSVSGLFKVQKAKHTAYTESGDWKTSVEALAS